jgi:uncharacterized protein (TIGR00369 family)
MGRIRLFMEEQIPFNRFLGLRLTSIEPGFASLLLPFRTEFVGDPFRPALHGGTLSTLADTAGGAALFSVIEYGDVVSTVDLRIDYLRPGAPVDTLAEARVVRLGGRVGVARISLWQERTEENESAEARTDDQGDRRLVAEGTGVYAVRRARG